MKNYILMGSFIDNKVVPRKTIRDVVEYFDSNKIFVFEVISDAYLDGDKKKFLFTFNIPKDKESELGDFKSKYRNTIQLHRNKQTNTLYTINGLNAVVKKQSGKKNVWHKVDWANYKNSCVVVDKEGKPKVMSLNLYDVIEI